MTLDIEKLDFDRCEDEPIHIPESIQSYGYLFALNAATGAIEITSQNVADLFCFEKSVLGTVFSDLLDEDEDSIEVLQEAYQRARSRGTRLPVRIRFRSEHLRDKAENTYFAVLYDSDGQLVIELEPAARFRNAYTAEHYIKIYALSIAPKFKTYESLDLMAREIVDTIKYITDMERVVLYRFNEDGSGKVIAEAKVDDIESYLGLYYPASDIPPQARELYKKNWVRLTPNVDLAPSRLVPEIAASGRQPLDLTHSLLRTMSPIHQQYIRNQGLRSSFSMSLVTHDRLWGLISCHSRQTAYIPQDVRLQCENLSQLFSWHLYAKEEELFFRKKEKTDRAIQQMLDRISPTFPIIDMFSSYQEDVLQLMDADGFVFYSNYETVAIGVTPEMSVVHEIYQLAEGLGGKPFITDEITSHIGERDELNGIFGVMLIPLLEKRNYFTAWFRKEHRYIQKWAGSPDEKSAAGSKKDRLVPRTSFEVHIREISGTSRDFEQNDVDMASRFNRMFLAHALDVQERMRQNVFDLEQQDRHKNEFLATLAHELRNPLSPISTGVSLMEMTDSEEVRQKVIATIKRQVGYMSKLIDDLMDVSRIAQGKVRLEFRMVCVQDVVNDSVEMVDSLIAARQHELTLDVSSEPIWVNGDRARLSQVFSNILNNAAKYTEPGGRIRVHVEADEKRVSVRISDTGLGIPRERIDDVFTMFTQVEAHSGHTKGGLGIGLTLVERLVRLHKGKIYARSEGLNRGSEFEVLLPRVFPEADRQHRGTSAAGPATVGLRILIVDDNADVTSMLALLLQSAGHLTQTAENGEEALKLFAGFRPEVALLDIGLPDIDGYELCRRLRELPEAAETVFLSQSGWGNPEYRKKALNAGFREHFVKPLDMPTLEQELRRYHAGRRNARQERDQ